MHVLVFTQTGGTELEPLNTTAMRVIYGCKGWHIDSCVQLDLFQQNRGEREDASVIWSHKHNDVSVKICPSLSPRF